MSTPSKHASSRYSPPYFKYDDDVHRYSTSPPKKHRISPPALVRSDIYPFSEPLRLKCDTVDVNHRHGHIELRHLSR